jgi:hypothetical protein
LIVWMLNIILFPKRPLLYRLAVNHMVCFWHYWQDGSTWCQWRIHCYILEGSEE